MTTLVEKRNASKFCEFHVEVGHTTDECMHLKRHIEEMLKVGKLTHLIKELKKNNGKDQAKTAKKGEASGKDKPLAILMVQPWQRVAKQRITQTFSPELVISFPPLGEEDGMKGPMIIEAEMGGYFVHRMYMDGGSSSEILYEHCFNRFCLEIGDEEHSTSAWMNFMVVRSSSPYNGIIGRPGVRRIQAIPFTAHEMLKFPVTGGTVTLRSSRIVPLECTMVSGPGTQQPVINQVTEEKIKVAIHLEYPEQNIAIGFTLTEEGRTELYALLRRNLNIFAWKPADMTGVSLYIAEHRLNIREGCLPLAIKSGDGKKHDDSWRMCVDFKDLYKACPKDGYPLPKIDWKVESLCGYPFKCFLDAYKGYHQIKMAKEDEEKTSFITSQGIFCYIKMSFGLKNVGATYQRLVDKAFQKQIGWNLEVYVYDLVIKSRTEQEVIRDIEETFKTLREISMKLNLKKCTFGMRECIHKVNADGLQVCSDKVEAVLNLPSPKCLKDVQRLNGKLASLNRFLCRSSCIDGSGSGLILTNPKGTEFTYALRFRFDATNNEAEYEALIASLRIAEQIGVKNLQANVDLRLVANQVNGSYIEKEPGMIKYLKKVRALTSTFKEFSIKQVPRGENKKADALSKMASTSFAYLSKQVLVEELKEKSIDEKEVLVVVEEEGRTWMTPIYEYLTEEILLEEKRKARAICRKAGRYAVTNGILYKKSFLGPWLRCVGGTHRQTIETPFSLTYRTEAVIPIEIGMPTLRTVEVDMIKNDEALEINLDFLEERREQATIQEAKSKAKMEKYYNARVHNTSFKPGDLVYRNNEASYEKYGGKLGPKWEGPYEVTEALGKGAYKLRDRNGNIMPRTWNVCNLKKCYVHEM
ncbi:reverse transcriptase domain-containing protein [Tanacetum coccineum]